MIICKKHLIQFIILKPLRKLTHNLPDQAKMLIRRSPCMIDKYFVRSPFEKIISLSSKNCKLSTLHSFIIKLL